MEEVKENYVLFYIENDTVMGLDILSSLERKTSLLFRYMIPRCDGNVFIAGKWKEKAMEALKISESTYWRKIKELENSKLLVREGHGIYLVNKKLIRIISDAEKEIKKLKLEKYGL